jgi:hypothetical protein
VEVAAGRRSSSGASARQLGATLWEIQDVVRAAGAGRRIRRRARRAVAASPSHRDDDDGVDRVRTRRLSAFFFPVNVVTVVVSSVIFLSIFFCQRRCL